MKIHTLTNLVATSNYHLRNRKKRKRKSSSIPPPIITKMTSIAGYLKQKGQGKFITSWYNRYCILDNDTQDNKLWIYKNKQDHTNRLKPIEIIFIKHIESDSIKINRSENNKQFTFWIKNDQRSQYFLFEAESELQCTTWCEKLIENHQTCKLQRKSIRAMRKIAIFNKRSAEVNISSLKADRELYVGWCKSELSRKKYQSRYFVLTSAELRYWKNNDEYQSNQPPKVCIPLNLICDITKMDEETMQICVQFQDENGNYKLRLFELQSKETEDISNFYSGLSSSNWRRKELNEASNNNQMIIKRLSNPKIFSSPKDEDKNKPSQLLLKHQKTTFFRINAPEIDEFVDEDDMNIDQVLGHKTDDVDIEMERDSYAQLKRLWSNDVVERKSILRTNNDNINDQYDDKEKNKERNRVEFSTKNNIIEDYDSVSYGYDDDFEETSDEGVSDEASSLSRFDTVNPSILMALYRCVVRCCKSNGRYDSHQYQY